MKYLFILSFVLVHAFCGNGLGYASGTPVWTHFTYMFQHSGIVHLATNSLAFIGMYRAMEKLAGKRALAIYILLLGFALSFAAQHDIPTVGASGMVYVMAGMYAGYIFPMKHSPAIPPRNHILFLISILLFLVASYFKQNSNFALHIYSFLAGTFLYTILCHLKNARRL
ncbi:hypothetical protein FACS1894181_13230 [Bacteroidia bacterium]|nr:hypothetical protein FACS1894181_13230 [Bacteroidia bacterium]